MAEWQTADLSFNGLDLLLSALNALDISLNLLEPIYDTLTNIAEIVALLQQGVDLDATAIDAAFAAALATLEEFLSDAGGHVLFVPPVAPFARLPETPRVSVGAIENLSYVRMVQQVPLGIEGDGGNYGVYRKFVESIFDRNDFSAPRYSPDAFMGGGVLFFGADNFPKMLDGMLTLGSLFDGALSLPVDNYQLPVPQNVKARPIATMDRTNLHGFPVVDAEIPGDTPLPAQDFVAETSTKKLPEFVSIRSFWDAPKTVVFRVDYGPMTHRIKSWHVFVKPHTRIQAGEDFSQYETASFQVLPNTASKAEQDAHGEAPVLGNPNGVILQKLRPKTTYYISVAYTVEVEDRSDGSMATIAPVWETLSSQVRFRGEDQLPYQRFTEGIPTDWTSISSPVAVFPQVQRILLDVSQTLEIYRTTFADRTNVISDAAAGVQEILDTLRAQKLTLEFSLGSLFTSLENIDITVWAATFQGQGGTPFLVKAVGDLLLNQGTVNRPPFDSGDEVVSALLFVSGSEAQAPVDLFVRLLSLFLGEPASGFLIVNQPGTGAPDDPVPLDSGANPTTPENAVNLEPEIVQPLGDLGVGKDEDC